HGGQVGSNGPPEGRQRLPYRVFADRSILVGAVTLVLVGVGMAAWLLLVYGQGRESDRNQLEAIKTAGTIVIGIGGAGALWLAARRQRTTEIALRQKDRDQAQKERDQRLAEQVHAFQERVAK